MLDIISLLSTDGYIMCNKTLIKMFGGDCAILVGELCAEYNYYKSRDELDEDGSFYSTQDNIEEMTGLSPYAQRKALKVLQENEIIQIKRKGVPAKNYYKLNESQMLKIFTSRSEKNEELEVENFNINNNKTNKNNKKDTTKVVEAKPTTKKLSLYDKCVLAIEEYTSVELLRKVLETYLRMRLEQKDKPMYVNQWKGILNKLDTLADNYKDKMDIVQYALERGYASVYPLPTNKSNKSIKTFASEQGVNSNHETEDDIAKREEFLDRMKQEGKQCVF